jgi:hypothetical protein
VNECLRRVANRMAAEGLPPGSLRLEDLAVEHVEEKEDF